jgi:hypothetical protein
MKLLDLVVWIFVLNYFKWTNNSMYNKIWYVCENFRGPLKKVEMNHHFQFQHNKVVFKGEYLFSKQMGLLDLVVWICF